MTYSVALGYNWLYKYLSKEEKEKIENAIINNGLIPGINGKYSTQFLKKSNNWNPICNGSLAIGAIAILNLDKKIELSEKNTEYKFQSKYLEIESDKIENNQYTISINKLCKAIIKRTIDEIPTVYKEMEDGAYEEGTLYWEYGNSYLINFLSTAQLTFNNTFGLVKDEYLKNTILYPIYLTGKSSNKLEECKLYNYGDADEKIINTSASTWLANIYYKDEKLSKIVNWYQKQYFEYQNIYQLLWQNYDSEIENMQDLEETLKNINDKQYKGSEIAILQNNILEKDGFYIAAKAGTIANTNHSDLDAGSLILDAKGTRWIEEQGREYYNVKGYWDKTYNRWTYYKKRAESHSTIVLERDNNKEIEDQKVGSINKITDFSSTQNQSSVMLDLSEAYNFEQDSKNKITRKIELDKTENKVKIEDNINLDNETNIYSMFNIAKNTKIELTNDNKKAILTQNVIQDDNTIKEEKLEMNILNSKYEWSILNKKPLNNDFINESINSNFKYNLELENEQKLCILIKNGKNEKMDIEIY